jgi:hypothetical protein
MFDVESDGKLIIFVVVVQRGTVEQVIIGCRSGTVQVL